MCSGATEHTLSRQDPVPTQVSEALTGMKIGALAVSTDHRRLLAFPSLRRRALGSRGTWSPRRRKRPDARQAQPHALSSTADTDRP